MCGLAGLVVLDRSLTHSIDLEYKQIFKRMLVNATAQGTDAAGIFTGNKPVKMYEEGEVSVLKQPGSARKLIETDAYNKVVDEFSRTRTLYMIGHTRASTHGTSADNKNNHPFVSGNVIGVHNGVISNHHELARKDSLSLKSQCDSEVIFSLVDKNRNATMSITDSIKDTCADLTGWYACFLIDSSDYRKIAVFRNRAPLSILYDKIDKVLLFATQKSWMERALKDSGTTYPANRAFEEISLNEDSGVVIDCFQDKSWATIHKFKLEDDDSEMAEDLASTLQTEDEMMDAWEDTFGPKKNNTMGLLAAPTSLT